MNVKHLALAMLVVAPLAAQANDTPISITADVPFYSKYVWRGINLINDPVFQPSVNLGYQNWNLNLWGNYDINNEKRFNEFDLTLSYSADCSAGSWTAGYVEYAYPSGGGHTREIFARFDFNANIQPYIELNYDFDEADGLYARMGASKDLNTSAGTINLHGWIGFADKSHNNYFYGNNVAGFADLGLEATWSKQLSENATGYVKLGYTALLDSNHLTGGPNRNNLIFGFGVGFGL